VFQVRQLFWEVDVLACLSCGLVFKEEIPKPAVLAWLYSSRYVHFQEPFRLNQDVSPLLARVDRLGRGPGKVLDIGCGAGSFVAACLARGWDAWGIDPYLPETDPGFSSRLKRITATDFAAEHPSEFDRVTLWAAWEHLIEPMRTIEAAFDMVKPGGLLLFNSPCGDSLHARLRGKTWSMVTLLEHLTFLTPKSASSLARRLGAKRLTVRFCGVPFPMGTGRSSDPQGLEPRQVGPNSAPARLSIKSRIVRLARENRFIVALMNRVRLGDHIELYLYK
jgi:2-polyprenyl-3-methyl-5-hydroxy-6-metoxy-1,4-benzoquinol methylase